MNRPSRHLPRPRAGGSAASRCRARTRSLHPDPARRRRRPISSRPARMSTTRTANRFPAPTTQIEHDPQKILLDSIKAPINGLYGIEDETGNISFWNYGELFGAIDVALFIIIIGGFLGVTMKTGAINAGIARVVASMEGREKLMIPILMVHLRPRRHHLRHGRGDARLLSPDHHGDDRRRIRRARGRRRCSCSAPASACSARRSIRSRPASPPASPVSRSARASCSGSSSSSSGSIIGIFFVMRYAEKVRSRSVEVARLRPEGGERSDASCPARKPERVRSLHRAPQDRPRALLPRLRGHDLRRHPLGGPWHRDSHAVVVVPRDDRLVPPLRRSSSASSAGSPRRT